MYLRIFGDSDVFGAPEMTICGCVDFQELHGWVQGDYADCTESYTHTETVYDAVNARIEEEWARNWDYRRMVSG